MRVTNIYRVLRNVVYWGASGVLALICAISILPVNVFAENAIRPQGSIPDLKLQVPFAGSGEVPLVTIENGTVVGTGMAMYFGQLYAWLVTAVAIIAVVSLMAGGMLWLTSRGNTASTKRAKEIITNALAGIVLTLGAYSILYLINPALVQWPVLRLGAVEPLLIEVKSFTPAVNSSGGVTGLQGSVSHGKNCTGDLKWGKLSTGLTAAGIDQIVKGTPLAGGGSSIFSAAQSSNIDPAFALAIWQHDSSFASAGIGKYAKNPGNIAASSAEVTAGKGCYIDNKSGVQLSSLPCPGGCAGNRPWLCYSSAASGAVDWFRYTKLYTQSNVQTVAGLITVYAPPSENDTSAYIDSVCNSMISWSDPSKQAQVKSECGCH